MSGGQENGGTDRLVNISLDERTVVRRSADVEHERAVAMFDLLEENHFALAGDHAGPYSLHLSVQDNRLLFDVRDEADQPIETVALADGIVWFEYAAICETARSAGDYIEIARQFHTVVLSNVPVMDDDRRDRVVRFVHLVDELYERNVNLILSAAAAPDDLYVGERLSVRFDRARSLLSEMQSHDYLAAEHLP